MELQTLANTLVAASIAHAFHSMLEPMNIRTKVKRLVAYIDKQTPPKVPQGIDTRPKALGLAFVMVALPFGLAYIVVTSLEPAPRTAIWFALATMLVIEVVNSVNIDKYHVEIEKVTRQFKK